MGRGRGVSVPVLGLAVWLAGAACTGGDSSGGTCGDDPCRPGCTVDCARHPECSVCGQALCAFDGSPGCRTPADCGEPGGGAAWACVDRCCLPVCAKDMDCIGACVGDDCHCDEGHCRPRPCSSSAECADGLACLGGACAPAPAAELAATCRIEPALATAKPGTTLVLSVLAAAADGTPLPFAGPVAFASDAPEVADVNSAGRLTAGTVAGVAGIEAAVGGASCRAELRNLGPVPAATLRVTVVDEATGLPVPDATVTVAGLAGVAATDAGGVALFAGTLPPRTVSVFHQEYAYLTVVGTGADDLLLRLRRDRSAGLAGGMKGRFGPDALFAGSELHVGIAGTSIPESLVDLSVESLLGPLVSRELSFVETFEAELPQGLALGVGTSWFVDDPDLAGAKGPFFAAQGVPSACADPGRSAAGTCGTRAGWGLAGNVPLQVLLDELPGGFTGEVTPGVLLATLLPQLSRFRSAVVPDVEFPLEPTRCPDADGDGAPDATCAFRERTPDPAAQTRVDLVASRQLALRSLLDLPALPSRLGRQVGGVLAVAAVQLPGRGLVPLGLTAALDATGGEVPDGAIGPLPLRLAPAHGGLEGHPYLVAALALDLDRLDGGGRCTAADRGGCTALSGILHRGEELPYGGTVFFDGEFLTFADGDFDSALRAFFVGTPVAGATVGRLAFADDRGREWHVWFSAASTVAVPRPPPGFDDRLVNGNGERASLSVQALRLDASFDALLGHGTVHTGNLAGFTRAFSSVVIPR